MGIGLVAGVAVLSMSLFLLFRETRDPDWLTRIDRLQGREKRVKALRSLLAGQARKKHDALMRIYPSGYVLFATDEQGNLVPGQPEFALSVGIDWDQARIVQVTEEEVSLIPPGVYFEAMQCVSIGKIVVLVKKAGAEIRLCRLDDRDVHLTFLFEDGEGMVCGLGLSHR